MSSVRLMLLIFFTCLCGTYFVSASDERIVGGVQVTDRTQFAYQVSLRSKSSKLSFCGGFIYNNNSIITAAHCVYDLKASNLEIIVGNLHIKNDDNMQVRQINKIIVHEDYDDNYTQENDIAILRLAESLKLNKYVNSIKINEHESDFQGRTCVVSGWGYLKEGNLLVATYLRAVNITRFSQSECKKIFNTSIKSGMLCAGGRDKDSCQGDSGGPLVCQNKLVGIVSWGIGCARPGKPGVYTNVGHYASWIKKNNSTNMQSSCALIFMINLVYLLNKLFM